MVDFGIQTLNRMMSEEVQDLFEECCGSVRWASSMSRERPFRDMDDIHHSADRIWGVIRDEDRQEAFAAHPAIGDMELVRAKSGASNWAASEQSSVASAGTEILDALERANEAYLKRFGYRFIICATGKTAEEMLASIERRLTNDPDVEFREASEQQRQILHLRIGKMLMALEENEHRLR